MQDITEIDIIILSYAQNAALRTITENCIVSLNASEDPEKIRFNIIVIESEKGLSPFQYKGTTTVYPKEEFAYNKYLNLGIGMTSAKYICLCNNDLVFHQFWATEALKAFHKYPELSSISPFCSVHHTRMGFEKNNGIYYGYRSQYELAGWCLLLKRDVLRLTGRLDENYKFWCADNDYSNMLSVMGLRHALVSSSVVDHLEGATLKLQSQEVQDELTAGEFFYFEKKWNYRLDGNDWKEV